MGMTPHLRPLKTFTIRRGLPRIFGGDDAVNRDVVTLLGSVLSSLITDKSTC